MVERDETILSILDGIYVAGFSELLRYSGFSSGKLDRGLKALLRGGDVLQLTPRGPYALKRNKLKLEEYQKLQNRPKNTNIQMVTEALEEFRWLFDCPFPPVKYIASHPKVRRSPTDILEVLNTIGWREPSKEEEEEFELQFKFRAESAWQYKYERGKLWFSPDETARCKFEKMLTRFLEIYPNEVRNPHESDV